MKSFIGNTEAKLDVKGRVFIPAGYRKLLDFGERTTIVMRKDPDTESLTIYPNDVWEKKLNDLQLNLDEWNSDDQALLNQFVSEAEVLEIDSQGRVLIQKKYLQAIGATNEVLFVGGVNKFSIWTKAGFEKTKLQSADFAAKLREKMKKKTDVI